MGDFERALNDWANELINYHLPRWEELPDIQLYMDQVVTLIERYIVVLPNNNPEKIITAAMINNYVKLGLIPKPEKKRYHKIHLAYLIAITILKQVLTISEINDGILLQSKICGGNKEAYNLFCTEQEKALQLIAAKAKQETTPVLFAETPIMDHLAIQMATSSFACKLLAEKILQLKKNQQKLKPVTNQKGDGINE